MVLFPYMLLAPSWLHVYAELQPLRKSSRICILRLDWFHEDFLFTFDGYHLEKLATLHYQDNGFVFGGRGGHDKPDQACLGLLSLSLSLSRFTPSEPLPNSSKIDWFNFY